jgi:hypothetical protein
MAATPRFDSAYWILYGYPVAFVTSFLIWPEVTGFVWLAGCAIAIPLFFLQGRGEPVDPDAPKQGFSWFRLVLAGVAFSWPFILATVVAGWRHWRRPESGR